MRPRSWPARTVTGCCVSVRAGHRSRHSLRRCRRSAPTKRRTRSSCARASRSTTIRPSRHTRQEMFTLLHRALGLIGQLPREEAERARSTGDDVPGGNGAGAVQLAGEIGCGAGAELLLWRQQVQHPQQHHDCLGPGGDIAWCEVVAAAAADDAPLTQGCDGALSPLWDLFIIGKASRCVLRALYFQRSGLP